MKTDVYLVDGRVLRAHFSYLREDFTPENPRGPFANYDYHSALTDAVMDAFNRGQISNYDHRRSGDYPSFDSILDSHAVTVCELTIPEKDEKTGLHKVVSVGFSFCSQRDQFSKTIGRRIAFSRALSDLKTQGIEVQSVETTQLKK